MANATVVCIIVSSLVLIASIWIQKLLLIVQVQKIYLKIWIKHWSGFHQRVLIRIDQKVLIRISSNLLYQDFIKRFWSGFHRPCRDVLFADGTSVDHVERLRQPGDFHHLHNYNHHNHIHHNYHHHNHHNHHHNHNLHRNNCLCQAGRMEDVATPATIDNHL